MKTIRKLKLNHLSNSELKRRQMSSLKGGDGCPCTCTIGDMIQWMAERESFAHHCDGTCACVCGGEDAQANTDNRFFTSLFGY